ncbi:odorant receptor 43a-like [Macrosteles quadrilineatus]|uniref:odorant receptor 43a-like n=1 Tax=Macrosteles quadrilineatus TaxID=74068 RepID=UPI0023E2985E|nr:odorant receptor 43a-like [Macrosteles quadrilineatus]
MQLSDVEQMSLKRKYRNSVETDTSSTCTTEEQSRCFIRSIVSHHLIVKSLIQNVTKIHKYVFLTQFVFTISHSCFLAFNVYYTKNHTKILVKYSPYLLLSYYLLYIFCHNGQRLSDACERLFYAFCWCPWYDFPLSYRKSLLIAMSANLQPTALTGGGLFKATLATFVHGLQQSVSYTLLLNQVAPENNSL